MSSGRILLRARGLEERARDGSAAPTGWMAWFPWLFSWRTNVCNRRHSSGSPLSSITSNPMAGWVLAGCPLWLSLRSLARLCAPQGADPVPGGHGRSPGHCGHSALYAETASFARTAAVGFVGYAAQYRACPEHLLALRAQR